MEKGQQLYEGKAKRIFATDDQDIVWVEYKNSATAGNGAKKAEFAGKGRLNNLITSIIFEKLTAAGIPNHFIKQLSDTEQLVKSVTIIPLEVVTRNVIAGSLSKRLGKEEGIELDEPILEFYYKDDELGDPLVNEDHIHYLQAATAEQVLELRKLALEVNDFLKGFFSELEVRLVDFKLEFGLTADGQVLLADEISPDTCRFWDMKTNAHLDKDLFRRDMGDIINAYEIILDKISNYTQVTK